MRTGRYTKSDWRKKGISRDGSAIVEFALVAGIFFIVIFGIIELGRMMLMYHHVGNAAREGTRYAIVHGSTNPFSTATANDVQTYIRNISPLDPSNMVVNTTWPDGNNNPGSRVNVQVQYNFQFTLPILFGSGIPLTSTSQMVISY